jgi:hypothetical protein
LLTFHPLPMTVSALLGNRSHEHNLVKSRGACHCTPLAANAQKDVCGRDLLLVVMHVCAIEQSGHSKAVVMWNRVICVRGCICISNVRARTCHPLDDNLHRAFRQQSGCCTEKDAIRLLHNAQQNAMPDNTSGVSVPLATAACLAVSAVSFILGRGFDQRRRRGPATTLQDAEFVMVPQLAAGKHEVGPAGEWRRGVIHYGLGWCRLATLVLTYDWVAPNRSWLWTFVPCC